MTRDEKPTNPAPITQPQIHYESNQIQRVLWIICITNAVNSVVIWWLI